MRTHGKIAALLEERRALLERRAHDAPQRAAAMRSFRAAPACGKCAVVVIGAFVVSDVPIYARIRIHA